MGVDGALSPLAPILRSDTQGRILARLFADPDVGYNLTELVAWAGSSMPTVQREIERAEAAGIVTSTRMGPTRVVRANPANPLYRPLREIIVATSGPPAVIADEFAAIEGIDSVVLFGSWAARYIGEPGRAPNDIDVLVIGSPDRDEVDDAAERAEGRIGLPVQATVRTKAQWNAARESFVREVKSRPLLAVQGLRGTTRGGHVVVIDAVRAQLNDPAAVRLGTTISTAGQLDGAFSEMFPNVTGESRVKAIRFFMSAAEYAGVPQSPLWKAPKAGGQQSRKPKARKPPNGTTPPTNTPTERASQSLREFMLASGRKLTVSLEGDVLGLNRAERQFVMGLIDQIEEHVERHPVPPAASTDAVHQENSP